MTLSGSGGGVARVVVVVAVGWSMGWLRGRDGLSKMLPHHLVSAPWGRQMGWLRGRDGLGQKMWMPIT